jgi:hypothetical protein
MDQAVELTRPSLHVISHEDRSSDTGERPTSASRRRRSVTLLRSLTQHQLAVEHPGSTFPPATQSVEYNAVSKSRYTWYTSGATKGRVWL